MDRVNHGENAKSVTEEIGFPSIYNGAEGVRFIENCVASADNGSIWVDYK